MLEDEDLYEILQVHPAAQPEVIQAVYERLAQLYQPDVYPSREAAELLTRLNRAYEVLSDPEQRTATTAAGPRKQLVPAAVPPKMKH